MTATAMRVMAPELDAHLLDAADELLAPLRDRLAGLDPAELEPYPPVPGFDPVLAGGPRSWRPLRLPAPPGEPSPALPDDGRLTATRVADLAALVRAGELDAAEVHRAFVRRIAELDPAVNAYLTVAAEWHGGTTGPLAGVPIGLKDLIDTAGIRTTCGSRLLSTRVPARDAEAWRLLRQAGASLLGKLNTHEFAAGVTAENEHYGPVRNPYHLAHMAGGSSGGAAAAVACGTAAAALGTDTGGSVRIPAACCGVVGLKPTYGLVPVTGTYPLAWTLDHVGPLARTVRDAAMMLDVLAGTRAERAARAGAHGGLADIRVGVPQAWLAGSTAPVVHGFRAAVRELERQGATVLEVTLPDADLLTAVNRVIAYAEGSAWHEPMLRASAGYEDGVRARLEAGRFVLAGEYLTAQRLRAAACRQLGLLWGTVDVLIVPTLPCTAPKLGSATIDLDGRAEPIGTALPRYTAPFSITGVPALTLPFGQDTAGLPIGVQFAAPPGEDARLCYVAAALEAARAPLPEPPVCSP
ncbi:amidase [Amycolatopsis alkalitolerans]|uniref:Amidase n=1 Tax=Amycolatopsis alkalitolerans TaxID=2547244 RepID=A0A5C4M1I6_9PSEU|nr:amidase [Amycolatopsis alkalitolerans]